MKYRKTLYAYIITACLALLIGSCKKGAPLESIPPQIVKVQITGSTTKELDFIYGDSVVASQGLSGGFVSTVLLNITGQNHEITVREKGSTAEIVTWNFNPSEFNQTFSLFYDGVAVYDGVVRFKVKGYAMEGELEFLLDGVLQGEGSSKIDKTFNIPINKTETRQLQVRKKGETTILTSKTIDADPVDGQSLTFLFDGMKIVDNIQVDPPSNPDNMAINAQFTSTLNNPSSTTLYFTGGNKIDLVFYKRKQGTENDTRAIPELKTNPEIRVSLPTDGTNVSFELPPLANPDEDEYSVDICRNGTEEIPYIKGTSSPSTFPDVRANQGRYGSGIIFLKGSSKVLIIKDVARSFTSPTPRHRIPIINITDLSEYF